MANAINLAEVGSKAYEYSDKILVVTDDGYVKQTEAGKGLSTNDYDAAAKAKVDAIPADPKYTDTVYDDTEVKEEISQLSELVEQKLAGLGGSDESVVAQIEGINRKLEAKSISLNPELIGYYRLSGSISNATAAIRSDLIPFAGYTKLEYCTNMGTEGFDVAFFDASKNLLKDLSIIGDGVKTNIVDLATKSGAVYLSLGCYGTQHITDTYYAKLYNDDTLDVVLPSIIAKNELLNESVYGEYDFKNYKTVVAYTTSSGAIKSNSLYTSHIIKLADLGNFDKIYVTTVANKPAPVAVYFNGDPEDGGTVVTSQDNFTYNDSTLLPFTHVELNINPSAKYIIINGHSTGETHIYVQKFGGTILRLVEDVDKLNQIPHEGKRILYLGDSITNLGTTERGWPGKFHKYVKGSTYVNVAVSGAHWTDYTDTVLDGNPVINGPDANHNNTISNQVEKVSVNKTNGVEEYQDFDSIIIACGTNDTPGTDYGIDTQFTVDGEKVAFEDLDRKTWAGAMRYAYERLRGMYPNADFFICTPLQKMGVEAGYSTILDKRNHMIEICNRISDVTLIDTFNCGICNLYEVSNAPGRYLIDGLHPNADGADKMAKYNARAFVNFYNINL